MANEIPIFWQTENLVFGRFPEGGLKDARLARDKARLQLAEGIDPNQEKQRLKREEVLDGGEAFSDLAKEWWEHQKGTWVEGHATRVWSLLETNSFSELDKRPIDKIRPQDILLTIRKIEEQDALDVAARTLQDVRRIFRYEVQTGRLTHNPAGDLTGVATRADIHNLAQLGGRQHSLIFFDKLKPHGLWFAKNCVAFFNTSLSSRRSRFSLRSLTFSRSKSD